LALDIVVIGAGIVVMCCAVYLRRDGHQVTALDPVPPGGSRSFGNQGGMAPGSRVPLATPGIRGNALACAIRRGGATAQNRRGRSSSRRPPFRPRKDHGDADGDGAPRRRRRSCRVDSAHRPATSSGFTAANDNSML